MAMEMPQTPQMATIAREIPTVIVNLLKAGHWLRPWVKEPMESEYFCRLSCSYIESGILYSTMLFSCGIIIDNV